MLHREMLWSKQDRRGEFQRGRLYVTMNPMRRGKSIGNRFPAAIVLSWSLLWSIIALSACSLFETKRVLYDQEGVRIGTEVDPSIARADHPIRNSHPANLTSKDIETLLEVVQVSGWSGTLAGLLEAPRPVPLFSPKELSSISPHLADAFHEAKPTERVFFSLPKPDVAYSEDRTAGSLFLRGRYLHVVVKDHSSFIRTDTAGGEDIRDTKGMKLWVESPAQAAMVPDLEEPRWAPFETVHVSLNVKEILAQKNRTLPVHAGRDGTSAQNRVSTDDVQLQLRDLTKSNQELRSRLDEQNKRVQELNDQLDRLRLELAKPKPKIPPSKNGPGQ